MNILNIIAQPRITRSIASFFLLLMACEILMPLRALALTSGPSQPEVQSFEPIATTQMVDPFTGDFTYNIPLLDVGGYPINISYHSGISMHQEASCVGLGWNINPGVIARDMRGVPDDFHGKQDKIRYVNSRKNNYTASVGVEKDVWKKVEANGAAKSDPKVKKLTNWDVSLGIQWNNYRGVGYEAGLEYSQAINKTPLEYNLSLNYNAFDGYDADASLSANTYKTKENKDEDKVMGGLRGGLGLGFNSRQGIKALTFTITPSKEILRKMSKNKSKGLTLGYQGSFSMLAVHPTFYPSSGSGIKTGSYQFSYKPGKELFGLFPNAQINASYSWSALTEKGKDISRPAYGYIYLPEAYSDPDANGVAMDYNRVNEKGISKFSQNIYQSQVTHDVYNVSGQGTGAVFKPYLSALGTVYQPEVTGYSTPSGSAGFEFGTGTKVKLGVDVTYVDEESYSGVWDGKNGNRAFTDHKYDQHNGRLDHEPVFFKNVGEKTITNKDYYDKLGGSSAVSLEMEEGVRGRKGLKNKLKGYAHTGKIVRNKREARSSNFFHLTAKEAETFGVTKYRSTNAKDHHIGEVTVLNPDGMRYVYGLPLYNKTHKEVTFNFESSVYSTCNGSLNGSSYTATDASTGNKKGKDHFYTSTSIDPYAHSYYLTAVLSPDYVDVDQNGPSFNDLGNYVIFKYEVAYEQYKWRTPYTTDVNKGNLHQGLQSNLQDDKISYVYGTKEVWYLSEVESKNETAIFTYDKTGRKDTREAAGESGGVGSNSLWVLQNVSVYKKTEAALSQAAVPLKTAHFAYSYELCPNVPNNAGTNTSYPHPLRPAVNANASKGKLTLHKIWFTYQNSTLGAESPYVFEYKGNNPAYDFASTDRWGSYKYNYCSGLNNTDYPYVSQQRDSADKWAAAWNLTDITLPSGGKITMQYESDDYAYVQDRAAMQMFKVRGFGKQLSDYSKNSNMLYDQGFGAVWQCYPNRYVFFDIDPLVTSGDKDVAFREKYIKGMKEMFFKMRINLSGSEDSDKHYELVEGFAELELDAAGNPLAGVVPGQNIGWVKVKEVELKEKGLDLVTHPFTKTAWQFTRLNAPYLVYPGSDWVGDPATGANWDKKLIYSLVGEIPELLNTVLGINTNLLLREFSRETELARSVVRLYNPAGKKAGGGCRVKKLSFSDTWDAFGVNEDAASYSTLYDYSMPDGTSSGVASYEPLIGGEENPFKVPIRYTEEKFWNLALANELYDLEPYGEFLYPGASVGYRNISVRSEYPQDKGSGDVITRHAAGKTVYEFYTSYDFPTISKATLLDKYIKKAGLASFLGVNTSGISASQGFVVELNDMHGKPKSEATYAENSAYPIQKVEYFFHVDAATENSPQKHLNNNLKVLNKDGSFEDDKLIGVDIDLFSDVQESQEIRRVPGLAANIDFGALLSSLVIPKYTRTESFTRTASMTKLITRSGVLARTVVTENGFAVETENLAFDSETGEVLLTRTKNEHNDDLFNLTYPAHWSYDGMGQAYKNLGLNFSFVMLDGLGTVNAETGALLARGDELYLRAKSGSSGSLTERYWILHLAPKPGSTTGEYEIGVINASGVALNDGTYQARIIRSGRRNMQSLPVGSVVSLATPLSASGNKFARLADFSRVLNAGAVEYQDEWQQRQVTGSLPFFCTPPGSSAEPRPDPESSSGCDRIVLNNLATIWDYLHLVRCMKNHRNSPGQPTPVYIDVCDDPEECPAFNFYPKPILERLEYDNFPTDTDPDFDPADLFEDFDVAQLQNPFQQWLEEHSLAKVKGGPNAAGMGMTSYADEFRSYTAATTGKHHSSVLLGPKTAKKIRFDLDTTNVNPAKRRAIYRFYNTPPTEVCKIVLVTNKNYYYNILNDKQQMATARFESVPGEAYKIVTFPHYPQIIFYMQTDCFEEEAAETPRVPGTTTVITPPAVDPGTVYSGINPFLTGIFGNWHASKSYVYFEKDNTGHQRDQALAVGGNLNSTYTREAGIINSFQPFWQAPSGGTGWVKPSNLGAQVNPWTWNSMVTQYNPDGFEAENADPQGIYSSALYSYQVKQPVAVATNARLSEFLYDGFEDYNEFYFVVRCTTENQPVIDYYGITREGAAAMAAKGNHWALWNSFNPHAHVVSTEAHTGTRSLRLRRASGSYPNYSAGVIEIPVFLNTTAARQNYRVFQAGTQDHLQLFAPAGTDYLISYWVKGENANIVNIKISGAQVAPYGETMINAVDGWYKVERRVTFATPPASQLLLTIESRSASPVYIDDLRIQPMQSQVKSFVYDPQFLRLSASLDENNFASFFEYDEEGNLIRTKKETERGIFTITENRKNIRRNGN